MKVIKSLFAIDAVYWSCSEDGFFSPKLQIILQNWDRTTFWCNFYLLVKKSIAIKLPDLVALSAEQIFKKSCFVRNL